MVFSDIYIIFNPISTGPGKQMAEAFRRELKAVLPPSVNITLKASAHAGHGEELAQYYAGKSQRALIVSASGDGGYHDVVNGVLASGSQSAVTCLLPAGNANDHYNFVHTGNTVQRIKKAAIQRIDLLAIEGVSHQKSFTRYAHSYVGVGLTPQVGKELNKTKLTRISEGWIAIKNLFLNSPVKITVNERTARYQTLVCSNIGRMAKLLVLSGDASVTDGKFEVTGVRSSSFISLLAHLIRASTIGLGEQGHYRRFVFTCHQDLLIQLDGEIFQLDKDSTCSITCKKQLLPCIV